MTLPPKLEKLKENWPAKVFAFAAALFLYGYHQISLLDTRTLTVPLEIRGTTTMETVGHVDRYVRVTLRGTGADINRLGREDFTAYVDLSQEDSGGQVHSRVHLDMSASATALETLSVDVSPNEVSLTLEPRIARYVPVEPVIVGSLPEGYEVTGITCEPSQIRIAGTEHLVSAVTSLETDGIFLDGRTESFTQIVAPYTAAGGFEWDSADAVEVTVEVAPIVIQRTFNSVAVAVLNTSENMEIEIQSNRRGEITLSGTQLRLEPYTISPVGLFIDGSAITSAGEWTVPVVPGISQYFSVKGFSPSEVTVIARMKELPEPEDDLPAEDEQPESAESGTEE